MYCKADGVSSPYSRYISFRNDKYILENLDLFPLLLEFAPVGFLICRADQSTIAHGIIETILDLEVQLSKFKTISLEFLLWFVREFSITANEERLVATRRLLFEDFFGGVKDE